MKTEFYLGSDNVNQNPNEPPLNRLESCWNYMDDTRCQLLKENKKKCRKVKNYIPATGLDTLQEACDKLQDFIDENTD